MALTDRQKNNFDFLRLVASLCVTFSHSFNYSYPNYIEPLYTVSKGKFHFAYFGLCIFFSLSGFLIAKSASNSRSILHFLWKRILRIQPLLLVVCIATVFLLGPFFTTLTVQQYFLQIHTWTYFRNVFPITGVQFTLPEVFTAYSEKGVNGSLWTLVVEERLYLASALILFIPKIGKVIWYLFVVSASGYFITTILFPEIIPYQFNYTTSFYMLLFINSASLYLLKINFENNYLTLAALSLVLYLGSFINCKFTFLQVFCLPIFIVSIAYIRGRLNKAGKYGDFSYGIYVFSFPVQQMLCSVKILKENPYLQFVCTLLIVFPLAVLSWHFIEKKMLVYKNKLV